MVHFHRDDLRRELRGMSVEPEAVAYGQDALGHPHDRDARPLEIVHHRSDQLLRHRYSSRASPTTISWRLRGRYLIATCAVVTQPASATGTKCRTPTPSPPPNRRTDPS